MEVLEVFQPELSLRSPEMRGKSTKRFGHDARILRGGKAGYRAAQPGDVRMRVNDRGESADFRDLPVRGGKREHASRDAFESRCQFDAHGSSVPVSPGCITMP